MISLDALDLTADLLWVNEYAWSSVGQVEDVMSDGSVVVQSESQQTGRLITLVGGDTFGYVTKAVVDQLRVKSESPGLQMTLTLNDARTFNVVFVDDRFKAQTVADHNNPSSDYLYSLSLYLMVLE